MRINPAYLGFGLGAVSGAVLASGLTYYIAVKKLNKEYDEALQLEPELSRNRLEKIEKKAKKRDEELRKATVRANHLALVKSMEYKSESAMPDEPTIDHVEVTDETDDERLTRQAQEAYEVLKNISSSEDEVEHKNVFDSPEEPVEDRDPTVPYIITEDEFLENKFEYQQLSMTYYAGDDILADQRDDIVDDTNGTVGDDNLTRFGVGDSLNLLYVRNERLELDFEISKSDGEYAQEVHGFIRHSHDSRKTPKFRVQDE